MNENAIIRTVPAANELHKVPGFDPMKHLRRTVNDQGKQVLSLEPRYQRLWFRLACPKGRMLLNPLRITDQLAIFEAKVFFHKDDSTPASSFTANKAARETPDYIRAAQDEALKEALDNAGFGIQLCDMVQAPDEDRPGPSAPPIQTSVEAPAQGEPAPVVQTAAQMVEAAKAERAPAQEVRQETPKPTPQESVRQVEPQREEPQHEGPQQAPIQQEITQQAVAQQDAPLPEPAPQEADPPMERQQSMLSAVLNFPARTEETPVQAEMADTASEPAEASSQASPGYTDDMPVEDICQVMTLEEAQAVVVPSGPCMCWTMVQVAQRRPSSLRFYQTSFCQFGNIQKAAAALIMQNLEQQKAG